MTSSPKDAGADPAKDAGSGQGKDDVAKKKAARRRKRRAWWMMARALRVGQKQP
jgi:hypothetical protein